MDESVNEVIDYDEYAGDSDYDYQIDEDEDYFSEGSGAQEEQSDTEYVDVEDETYDYEDYGEVSTPVDLPLGNLNLLCILFNKNNNWTYSKMKVG